MAKATLTQGARLGGLALCPRLDQSLALRYPDEVGKGVYPANMPLAMSPSLRTSLRSLMKKWRRERRYEALACLIDRMVYLARQRGSLAPQRLGAAVRCLGRLPALGEGSQPEALRHPASEAGFHHVAALADNIRQLLPGGWLGGSKAASSSRT